MKEFLQAFKDRDGNYKYFDRMNNMMASGTQSFVVDYLEGLKDRERENLIVSLNKFVASRLEKIVKLAAASPLSPELDAKLAAEEKELYIMIHNASTEFKKGVLRKFD